MSRLPLLVILGVVVLAAGGAGFAARSSDGTSAYGLVDANKGGEPTFDTQDGMQSARRVSRGRYCLLASVGFSGKVVGVVSADVGRSGGSPGLVAIDSTGALCQSNELAVVTYGFTARGRPRLSNTISFVANPEG